MFRRKTIILPIGGGGGTPQTGTLNIVENGTYDVSEYAEVDVDVPYTDNYLCFTASYSPATIRLNAGTNPGPNVEYSFDKVTWTTWDYSAITLNYGDKVYMRGNNPEGFSKTANGRSYFIINNGAVDVSGNIMTLNSYLHPTGLVDYNFYSLFSNCSIIDASNLELPATTLANYCYSHLFSGCNSLISAPILPATNLAENCYGYMFYKCYALRNAPALPATTLAEYCYYYMFGFCNSLTTAPTLPATTLANYCYRAMFYSSGLTSAPALPATSLAQGCYMEMFMYCGSLVNAPALPATAMTSGCYNSMFRGCSSLVTPPALPSTSLANQCYDMMFMECSSLATAPALPATTLASQCYEGMFSRCTSLTTAPELPATTLAYHCYYEMFYNCSSLNDVTTYAENWNENNYTVNWLAQVPQSGTFHKLTDTVIPTNSPSGIPYGWTVSLLDTKYFYIENIYNGANTITVNKFGTPTTGTTLAYSFDKSTWTTVTYSDDVCTISIPNQNQKLYFRSSDGLSQSSSNYYRVYSTNNINIGGDLKTLVDYTDSTIDTIPPYNFYQLFYSSSSKSAKIVDTSNLTMDNIIYVDSNAFYNTFRGCTTLITPIRELPATYGGYQCYKSMYYGATSMTSAPIIKISNTWSGHTGNGSLFNSMFKGCTSLQSVDLSNISFSATGAAFGANSMFDGCTNLRGPVVINNQGLQNSMTKMFNNCSSLSDIRYLGSSWNSSYATDWVSGVSSSGDFYNIGGATIPTGTNGIPTGWTEHSQLPITYLSYIHTPTLSSQPDQFINTGIKFTQNMSFRLKGKYKQVSTGSTVLGTDSSVPDNEDWRMFWYGNNILYYDIFNGRYQTGWTNVEQNIDFTLSNFKIYDNINSTYLIDGSTQTISSAMTNYDVNVSVSSWWLQSLEIFDDNGNTVFNGLAALKDGVYGLWDSVTNQMFTNTNITIVGEP